MSARTTRVQLALALALCLGVVSSATEQLEIQVLNSSAAVVTFHLRNSERTARRTFVVSKVDGHWLVVHLHASNVATPSAVDAPTTAAKPHL